MCITNDCGKCKERYECETYHAYLGFGKYNVTVDKIVKRTSTEDKTLDYYDKVSK